MLPEDERSECFRECGVGWVEQGEIDAETLAESIAALIYNQGKAKILNLLESQFERGSRLNACGLIVQDIIGTIAKDAANMVRDFNKQ